MNCFINHILIFNKEGDKRLVSFKPGLNIITGKSKTGKSALIEIVDYCFCSKTSNIPRGVISEFAYVFVTILKLPSKYIVIARKSYMEGGNTKVSVKVEFDKEVIDNIDLNYINRMQLMQREDAQKTIEQHLNLSVSNMATSHEADDWDRRKAGLRDMTSFLFQHQNLLASKHALFYRFDDSKKRQGTINSFPVFSGWVNDEYYALRRDLEDKEKMLRHIELSTKKKAIVIKQNEDELKGYFRNYYALISQPFNEGLNIIQLVNLRKQLPDYKPNALISDDFSNRFKTLSINLNELSKEFHLIGKQIKDFEETEKYANEFQVNLKTLSIKATKSEKEDINYSCPTCGQHNENVTEEIVKINKARTNLQKELSQLTGYAISYQKEIDELQKQKEEKRKQISLLTKQIEEIKQIDNRIKQQKDKNDAIIYAKAQLDLRIELFEKEDKVIIEDNNIETLKGEIEIIKKRLTVFNITNFEKRTEVFFNYNMVKLGEKLDFEKELTPLNFHFYLKDFKFVHIAEKIGEIYLSEMGSGANWLTCHLSVFMSFLHHFAINEKSKVPSFLFLDQPSQVYFPSEFETKGNGKDNDIREVEKIYIAILEEIDEIAKKTGFYPQVIVTDHADNLDLGKYDFNNYICKRWTPEKDGALI